MTVTPDSPYRAEHAGHEYFFCCAGCCTRFVADPERYLEARSAARAPAVAAVTVPGAQYTCPMHPEVVRDHPEACPICGMALEPVMPRLEEGENPELADFRRRFWWTLPASIAVLLLAMGSHRWGASSAVARRHRQSRGPGSSSRCRRPSCSGVDDLSSNAGSSPSAIEVRTCGP